MAKKKNQSKKHRFKYAEPQNVLSSSSAPAGVIAQGGQSVVADRKASVAMTVGSRDFSYVAGDLKRIAVLASALVALEVLLWFLFSHTGVGNSVYSLVKV